MIVKWDAGWCCVLARGLVLVIFLRFSGVLFTLFILPLYTCGY